MEIEAKQLIDFGYSIGDGKINEDISIYAVLHTYTCPTIHINTNINFKSTSSTNFLGDKIYTKDENLTIIFEGNSFFNVSEITIKTDSLTYEPNDPIIQFFSGNAKFDDVETFAECQLFANSDLQGKGNFSTVYVIEDQATITPDPEHFLSNHIFIDHFQILSNFVKVFITISNEINYAKLKIDFLEIPPFYKLVEIQFEFSTISTISSPIESIFLYPEQNNNYILKDIKNEPIEDQSIIRLQGYSVKQNFYASIDERTMEFKFNNFSLIPNQFPTAVNDICMMDCNSNVCSCCISKDEIIQNDTDPENAVVNFKPVPPLPLGTTVNGGICHEAMLVTYGETTISIAYYAIDETGDQSENPAVIVFAFQYSQSNSATPSPTNGTMPSVTPTTTKSISQSNSASKTSSKTFIPKSLSPTVTPSKTLTGTPTQSKSISSSPEQSQSSSETKTLSSSLSSTKSISVTPTNTNTPTTSITSTITSSITNSPTSIATPTPTSTSTSTLLQIINDENRTINPIPSIELTIINQGLSSPTMLATKSNENRIIDDIIDINQCNSNQLNGRTSLECNGNIIVEYSSLTPLGNDILIENSDDSVINNSVFSNRINSPVVNFQTVGGQNNNLGGDVEICLQSLDSSENQCLGFLDESRNPPEWVCEDYCLDENNSGLYCGSTDHFTNFALLLTGSNAPDCASDEDWVTNSWWGDLVLLFTCVVFVCFIMLTVIILSMTSSKFRNLLYGEEGARVMELRQSSLSTSTEV